MPDDVVYLSADRRVAIVAEPSRSYMWVLSRSKTMNEREWRDVEQRLSVVQQPTAAPLHRLFDTP